MPAWLIAVLTLLCVPLAHAAPSASDHSQQTGLPAASVAERIQVAQNTGPSLWRHNNSVMQIARQQDRIVIIYHQVDPRFVSAIRPGTELFRGHIVGTELVGNARVFKTGCRPELYEVRGSLAQVGAGGSFELFGPSPVRASNGCGMERLDPNSRNARLTFSSLTGSAGANALFADVIAFAAANPNMPGRGVPNVPSAVVPGSAPATGLTPPAAAMPQSQAASVTPASPTTGQTNSFEPFIGLWEGQYVCRRLNPPIGQIQIEIFELSGQLQGRQSWGRAGARAENITAFITPLSATSIRIQPSGNRHMDKNLSVQGVNELSGALADGSCSVNLVRVPNANDNHAEQALALRSTGLWRTSQSCDNNRTVSDVYVDIARPAAGRFRAMFTVFRPDHLVRGVLFQRMIGEYDAGNQRFRFVRDQGEDRITGIPESFQLNLSESSNPTIVAQVAGCTFQDLARDTGRQHRDTPLMSLPASGRFFQASFARQKCEALANWLGRVREEYPDGNFMRVNPPERARYLGLLFGDETFIPVFGQPLGTLTDQQRQSIVGNRLPDECSSDPLLRDRFENMMDAFQVFGRNTWANLSNASLSYNIGSQREIGHRLTALERQIDDQTAPAEPGALWESGQASLKTIRELARRPTVFLWPSDVRRLDERLNASMLKLADRVTRAEIEAAIAVSDEEKKDNTISAILKSAPDWLKASSDTVRADAQSRLKTVKAELDQRTIQSREAEFTAIADPFQRARHIGSWLESPPIWMARLSDEARLWFSASLSHHRDALAAPIVADLKTRIDAQPRTIEIAANMPNLASEFLSQLSPFSPATRQRFEQDMKDWREKVIQENLTRDFERLTAMPQNSAGLAAMVPWLADVEARYGKVSDTSSYAQVRHQFIRERSARLWQLAPEFEREANEGGTGQARSLETRMSLLNKYLSWEGDHALPPALEYKLILAEANK